MMAHIRRVGKDQVGRALLVKPVNDPSKIPLHDIETKRRPQGAGDVTQCRVNLNTDRSGDPLVTKYRKRGGEKTAGAERWIGKVNRLQSITRDVADGTSNLHGNWIGGCKLTKTLSFGNGCVRIERRLESLSLQLYQTCVMCRHGM
jgi:hypothetical protein